MLLAGPSAAASSDDDRPGTLGHVDVPATQSDDPMVPPASTPDHSTSDNPSAWTSTQDATLAAAQGALLAPSTDQQHAARAAEMLAVRFDDADARRVMDTLLAQPGTPGFAALLHALVAHSPANPRITAYLAEHLEVTHTVLTDTTQRLLATLRSLYLATPADARGRVLTEMLADGQTAVKLAGCDLAQREISAGTVLDPEVGDAVLSMLADPSPLVRTRAGSLVRQLAPEDGGPTLRAALARETDPGVAAGLLLACVRWPDAELVGPALAWASGPAPARAAAFDLLWKLWQAGDLSRTDDLRRTIQLARAVPDAQLQAPHIFLLANLGDAQDEDRLLSLLDAPVARTRKSAADALLWEPRHRAAILAAASGDAELFENAALAVMVHNPGRNDLLALLALPASRAPENLRAVLRASEVMSTLDVIAVAQDRSLPRNIRERLFAEAIVDTRVETLPERASARALAACELAQLYLDDALPDEALAALNSGKGLEEACGAQQTANLRCAALVGFGRIELAAQTQGDADAWLRGLELASGKPHDKEAIAAFEVRFESKLSEQQRARLDAVRAKIARAQTDALTDAQTDAQTNAQTRGPG